MNLVRFVLLLLLLAGLLPSLAAPPVVIDGRTYTFLGKAAHEHYEVSMRVPGGASQLDLVFAGANPENYARLLWTSDGLVLSRTAAGRTQALTRVNARYGELLGDGGRVVLRRQRQRIEVVANGRRVCRVLAPPFGKGIVAVCAEHGGAEVAGEDFSYQRVEPAVFGDDFMRTEEEGKSLGLWQSESGDWRMYSVMELIEANPDARIREGREPVADRSPNPFCLSGKGGDGALVLAGQPFWSDYRVGVSVRSMGSEFGLVFGAADADTHWLARWRLHSLGVKPNTLELVRREKGQEEVVAVASVAGRARGWYRLEAVALGSQIDVLVDGVKVLGHLDDRSVGGRIGLYARGTEETLFDDVALATVQTVELDSLSDFAPARREMGGQWQVGGNGSGLRFAATVARRELALIALGYDDWSSGGFAAEATVEKGAVAALVLGLQDADNHLRGEIDGHGQRVRLVQVRDGSETVLGETTASLPDGPVPVFLDIDGGTHVRLFVDGHLALRQRLAALPSGPVGLAVRGKGTGTFRKVQAFAELERDWEGAVDIERFANDPFMQGWASPRYAWILAPGFAAESFPQRYVHKGDFYGPFRISLPVDDGLRLSFGGDSPEDPKRYELAMQIASPQAGSLALSRDGKEVARTDFAPGERKILPGQQIVDEKIGALPKTSDTVSYGTLTVHRDGQELWFVLDGKEIMAHHDDQPLAGRTVLLDTPRALDLLHVGVERAQVRDYLFEKAATDWVQVGSWEVTNRFACDPRWSHMNGRGMGVAALWNKLEFEGDFTLEYYAGMRMRQGEMHEGAAKMYYPRVGDINVAFAATDMDLFSGYNVILQAWDPMWTENWSQFLRGGEILARTDRHLIPRGRHQRPKAREVEVAWDPGGRPVHGAWYYVKIRKTGGQFDVSFDDVPVFSVTDRDPLAGRRVALWTQHNSIVIARAKIGYRQVSRPSPRTTGPAEYGSGQAFRAAPFRPHCATHPGLLADFEAGDGGLLPFAGDQSAEPSQARHPNREGHVLRLENLYGGGDFGVALPMADAEATRLARIEFDYAMPAEARLNLYVSLAERPHERWFVTLSGPDEEAPNLHRLGRFEGAKADGEWHRASFDLGAALRRALPHAGPLHVRELAVAMLHEGYLNAGLGGNPQGTVWYMDNLLLRSHGPAQALFAWTPLDAPAPARYRVWFGAGDTPQPMPADGAVRTEDTFALDLPGAGDWLVQSAAETDGEWRLLPAVPVRVCEPVQVAGTEPADQAAWDGGAIRVLFAPGRRANLDLSRCALKAGEATIPASEELAAYDPDRGVLEFLPNPPGLAMAPGEETGFEFVFADDLLPAPAAATTDAVKSEEKADAAPAAPPVGRVLPALPAPSTRSHSWRLTLAKGGDRFPPSPVRLAPDTYRRLDFEADLGVTPLPESETALQRVPRGDGHALRVRNRLCGSTFGASLGWAGFDLGQNPILEFDYRLGPEANVGFELQMLGGKHNLSLTDPEEEQGVSLGQIPDVVADGSWRRARVDLTELLARSVPPHRQARGKVVGGVSVGDFGYAGNAPGAWYELDNLSLLRLASSTRGLELRWSARDAGGIAGYSYAWDEQPDTVPDEIPETDKDTATFTTLPEGTRHFHVRAIDRDGNAGPASHYPFVIDNVPPEIIATTPADGSKAAASAVSVAFGNSVSQIDVSAAQVFVNQRRATERFGLAAWNAEKRELTLDLLADWNLMRQPLKDGDDVVVRINGVKDSAGNETAPHTFGWKVDYAQDREPPPAPYLWSSDGIFQMIDHFGSVRHSWRPYLRGTTPASSTERVRDEERGGWCLRVRKEEAGPRFGVHNYARVDLDRSPVMAFDIRILPGTKVNVLLYIDKKYYAVRLTGGERLPVIGSIPEATDDGQWHRVRFDAREMLRKAVPEAQNPDMRVCAIAGWSDGNDVGATFYLDNFALIGPRSPLPLFSYMSADATGIADYRISFDQNPDGGTTEGGGSRSGKGLLAADKAGMWYIHAAARDGAGNWSETVHYPYLCTAPVPEAESEGLEATGEWRSVAGRGRVRGQVHEVVTPGGNRLLALQVTTAREGEANLGRQVPTTLPPGEVRLSAAVFSGAAGASRMKAELRTSGGRRLGSQTVELAPQAWAENVEFVFPEEITADAKPGERWTLTFLVDVGKGARDTFLFDSVRLASGPAGEAGAGGVQ